MSNLIYILHAANRRYQAVAEAVRASFKPTHHARKRAHGLGLSVDIERAIACPQNQVSHDPLPILDFSLSPGAVVAQAASEAGASRIAAALPSRRYRSNNKGSIPSIIIPALSCKQADGTSVNRAPVVLRGRDNPWRGPTSRFSPTSADSALLANEERWRRVEDPDVPVGEVEASRWEDFETIDVEDAPPHSPDDSNSSSSSSSYSSSSGPATPVSSFLASDLEILLITFMSRMTHPLS